MIDNFDQIAAILDTKVLTDDNFFFVQVIKRRKENPAMTSNNVTVDVLYVKDSADLKKKSERIIKRCIDENARAYITLNMQSKRKVALQTMKIIAECIANDNYNVANAYASAVGLGHQDPNKTWVVDIDFFAAMSDDQNAAYVQLVHDEIETLIKLTGKVPNIHRIPTKNGVHLITQPFNLQVFSAARSIDVHKNNPTVLFIA